MRIQRRAIWVGIVLLVLVLIPTGALAQTGGVKRFSNGISLGGEWLQKWSSSPDPYTQYGMPLTEVMVSETGERVVYLQRARFRETNDSIVVDPLGEMLYVPGKPANFALNTPACRIHPETGYHLCYAFLQAYASYGSMLGAPLADPEEENGRIYQAFQFGWLEWRPENPPNSRVKFVELGRIAYDLWEAGNNNIRPGSDTTMLQKPFTAYAFVAHSILPDGANQTLYVIARDASFEPVKDAIVKVAIEFPDGKVQGLGVARTDSDGVVKYDFNVQGFQVGQAINIRADLQSGATSADAGASFRIWH